MAAVDLILHSAEQCDQLGRDLAKIINSKALIFLQGELGAGKTTLARGYLHGLGYRGIVKSPTYTIVEPYQIGQQDVYHLDLYRLYDPEELELLGIRDYLATDAVLLIEWPERGKSILPAPDLTITLSVSEGKYHICHITADLSAAINQELQQLKYYHSTN